MNVILSFTNEYLFLDNSFPCEILYQNEKFNSVENAYKAIIQNNSSDEIKEDLMENLLHYKFSINNPLLLKSLINTKDIDLLYNNSIGDTYWGICNGQGQNKLGRLLMSIRSKRIQENLF